MNRRSQLLCVWSGPLFCVMFGVGMVLLAQFLPPPAANDSVEEVVELYSEHTDRLRAGLVLMMIGAAFFASWSAAISVALKRIEGRASPMTYTQLACGAAGVLVITLPVMVMIVASFRPDRNPEITQTLNDLAWILFIMVFAPVMVQCLSIAVAVLTNPEQRVFPRWVAYFNLWCAFLLLPGSLIPFFKSGPFAWHGILEFWLAAAVFFGWLIVMTTVLLGAVRRQSEAPEPVPAGLAR